MQIKNFDSNAQPLFIILDSEEKEQRRIAYTLNEPDFKVFLIGQKEK
jgi:DNA phosphorothioation-dependent restriction protein DptG